MHTSDNEKRRHVRTRLGCAVAIIGAPAGESAGRIINISSRGLLVAMSCDVAKGTRLKLKLLWPPSRFCTAEGEIIRLQRDRVGISLDQRNEAFEQLVHVLNMSDEHEAKDIGDTFISCAIELARK